MARWVIKIAIVSKEQINKLGLVDAINTAKMRPRNRCHCIIKNHRRLNFIKYFLLSPPAIP